MISAVMWRVLLLTSELLNKYVFAYANLSSQNDVIALMEKAQQGDDRVYSGKKHLLPARYALLCVLTWKRR